MNSDDDDTDELGLPIEDEDPENDGWAVSRNLSNERWDNPEEHDDDDE